ncbi:MAG: hypothetical protein V2J26_00050, partial [Pacificimonas sp.]|nr:hypothetical protein [Pacificimonas sp.]
GLVVLVEQSLQPRHPELVSGSRRPRGIGHWILKRVQDDGICRRAGMTMLFGDGLRLSLTDSGEGFSRAA